MLSTGLVLSTCSIYSLEHLRMTFPRMAPSTVSWSDGEDDGGDKESGDHDEEDDDSDSNDNGDDGYDPAEDKKLMMTVKITQ